MIPPIGSKLRAGIQAPDGSKDITPPKTVARMGRRDLEVFQIAVALLVGIIAIWYGLR